MERSVHPERLPRRGAEWARGEISRGKLPRGADVLLEELLRFGELPRGKAEKILDVTDRQARRVMSALTERGVAAAESSRAPLRPAFPVGNCFGVDAGDFSGVGFCRRFLRGKN